MKAKRLLMALLAIVFSANTIQAIVKTGTCGDNATYILDSESCLLKIEGTGKMNDFTIGSAPWYLGLGYVTKIEIAKGITSIGNLAFSGFSHVTSVTIPESVTSIGNEAFNRCSSLTSISIPNSVISIGERAFYDCSGLTSMTIPNSVTSIGNSAFSSLSGLTSVVIGNSVISIGENAFYGTGLTSIAIPESVTSLGYGAFNSCVSLTSVTLPNSPINIGGRAFADCSSLVSITIPNSVASIGNGAFSGCFFTKDNFVNNSSCTSSDNWKATLCDLEQNDGLLIQSNIAVHCRPHATSVTVPNYVINIQKGTFSGCFHLTTVTIPSSVTNVGKSAFRGCPALTSITIPGSVTSFGSCTFEGCNALTSVDLPSSVTYIDEFAFEDCKSLTSFTCRAPEPPRLGERVFDNVPQAIGTLYVPAKSVEAYKNADSWKDWGNIQAMSQEDEDGIHSVHSSQSPVQGTEIYDLQGRKVKNARNGLFIQNGKKILMK